MVARGRDAVGFTLMELVVVVGLISLIAAIALPQLAPVIAFSTHEGAARRLAGYGQNAMGRAALMHEKITVEIDLDAQEYWTMRWPEPPPLTDEEGAQEDLESEAEAEESEPLDPLAALKLAQAAGSEDATDEDTERLSKESEAMLARFDLMQRRVIEGQAAHVSHEESEGILGDVGKLFEDDFSLDPDEEEALEPEELTEPLLERTRLTDGIAIESVIIADEAYTSGMVEIELPASGLADKVIFYVRNEEREYFTVVWDPIVGSGRIRDGKVEDP